MTHNNSPVRLQEKGVHIAIFQFGADYRIKVCRSFPDGKGNWKESNYFSLEQFETLRKLMAQAQLRINLMTQGIEV